jgi:hypothetical protein
MKILGRTILAAVLAAAAGANTVWAVCAANTGVYDYSVTQTGANWTYNFSVLNGCNPSHQPLLTNFYIPYFADAGIANITVPPPDNSASPPVTWTYSLEPGNNLFGLSGAGVIDFRVTSTTSVGTGTLPGIGYWGESGFTFTSAYAPVKGPYAILQTAYNGGLYNGTTLLFGDPSIPGSPQTIAALASSVPEPASIALLVIGLCLLMVPVLRLRRNGKLKPFNSLQF